MIAGGASNGQMDSAEMLSLVDGDLVWRDTHRLPHGLASIASVPYKDSFLLVGGWNVTAADDWIGRTGNIYEFDMDNGWILREEKMQKPICGFVAASVPGDLELC